MLSAVLQYYVRKEELVVFPVMLDLLFSPSPVSALHGVCLFVCFLKEDCQVESDLVSLIFDVVSVEVHKKWSW